MREVNINVPDKFDISPSLIIGCGGTGVQTVAYLRAYAEKYFDLNSLDPVQFLTIDTAPPISSIPFGDKVGNICYQLQITNEEFRNIKKNYNSNNYKKLFMTMPDPDELDLQESISNVNNPQDGAGTWSYLGRLICRFGENPKNIYSKIKACLEKIQNRTASDRNGNNCDVDEKGPVRVYIISSLYGGSGAGMFLDVTAITHMVARSIKSLQGYDIMGMFFLHSFDKNVENKDICDARAYAALKEINHIYTGNNGNNLVFPFDQLGKIEFSQQEMRNIFYSNVFLIGEPTSNRNQCSFAITKEQMPMVPAEVVFNMAFTNVGKNYFQRVTDLRAQSFFYSDYPDDDSDRLLFDRLPAQLEDLRKSEEISSVSSVFKGERLPYRPIMEKGKTLFSTISILTQDIKHEDLKEFCFNHYVYDVFKSFYLASNQLNVRDMEDIVLGRTGGPNLPAALFLDEFTIEDFVQDLSWMPLQSPQNINPTIIRNLLSSLNNINNDFNEITASANASLSARFRARHLANAEKTIMNLLNIGLSVNEINGPIIGDLNRRAKFLTDKYKRELDEIRSNLEEQQDFNTFSQQMNNELNTALGAFTSQVNQMNRTRAISSRLNIWQKRYPEDLLSRVQGIVARVNEGMMNHVRIQSLAVIIRSIGDIQKELLRIQSGSLNDRARKLSDIDKQLYDSFLSSDKKITPGEFTINRAPAVDNYKNRFYACFLNLIGTDCSPSFSADMIRRDGLQFDGAPLLADEWITKPLDKIISSLRNHCNNLIQNSTQALEQLWNLDYCNTNSVSLFRYLGVTDAENDIKKMSNYFRTAASPYLILTDLTRGREQLNYIISHSLIESGEPVSWMNVLSDKLDNKPVIPIKGRYAGKSTLIRFFLGFPTCVLADIKKYEDAYKTRIRKRHPIHILKGAALGADLTISFNNRVEPDVEYLLNCASIIGSLKIEDDGDMLYSLDPVHIREEFRNVFCDNLNRPKTPNYDELLIHLIYNQVLYNSLYILVRNEMAQKCQELGSIDPIINHLKSQLQETQMKYVTDDEHAEMLEYFIDKLKNSIEVMYYRGMK